MEKPMSADFGSFGGRTAEIAHRLVRCASVTGTDGEAGFACILAGMLREHHYFAANPENLRLIGSHGSPQASSVVALVRGAGTRCLVLAGHYDVVSIANFGGLANLAFDPEPLTKALIEELAKGQQGPAQRRALADLQSRSFVPGRGMLDMKSGLAAGISVLERFADIPEREGNLLFVATPDEENRSRGMRSLRDVLPQLAKEWGLELAGGINLDATDDYGDGTKGRSMYFGSVGKYSPFAYVVGQGTHAGYPFEGVSTHLIGAEILKAVEINSELVDEAHGEIAPPPVCLEARDFRESYDVTTPDRSWISFNWLSHRRKPDELLGEFRALVSDALERALAHRQAQAIRYLGEAPEDRPGRVFTVAELKAKVLDGNPAAAGRFDQLAADLLTEENPLVVSRRLVALLVDEAGLEGPFVVIGFASLFYPHVHADAPVFRETVRMAAGRAAARNQTSIAIREFFPGISDMSFFGHQPDGAELAVVHANTPSADLCDAPPPDARSFPVVNIGPWGRDCHQKLERVHASYAFDVLPDIVFEVTQAVLQG
jgi:arginine utilization protein RocB